MKKTHELPLIQKQAGIFKLIDKFAEKITQGVFNYGPDEGTFVLRTAIRNNDDSVISHLYDDLPSFLDESKYVFISTGTCRIFSYSTTKQLDLNDATLK